MKVVLEECRNDTSRMKVSAMTLVLGYHHDFKHENNALKQLMHELRQCILYLQSFTES